MTLSPTGQVIHQSFNLSIHSFYEPFLHSYTSRLHLSHNNYSVMQYAVLPIYEASITTINAMTPVLNYQR